MKRFLKVILVMAVVFAVVGFGLTAGGVGMGATMGDISILDNGLNQVRHSFANRLEEKESDEEDFEDEADEQSDVSGLIKTYRASDVSEISLDLKYEEVILNIWNEEQVWVKVSGTDHNKVEIRSSNGSLTIRSNRKVKNRMIEISCPANKKFQDMNIQMGAGTIELDGDFKTDKLKINVGAGTLENSGSMAAQNAEIAVGVGCVEIEKLAAVNVIGECGMGSMEFSLAGKNTDYSYELKCGLGNLDVDGALETSLTSGSRTIENAGAKNTISLDCGMGEVNVEFEQEV